MISVREIGPKRLHFCAFVCLFTVERSGKQKNRLFSLIMTNLNTLAEFKSSPQMAEKLLAAGVVKTFAEGETILRENAFIQSIPWHGPTLTDTKRNQV